MSLFDNLVEFWNLDGSKTGDAAGTILTSGDGNDYFVEGKLEQGWDCRDTTGPYSPNIQSLSGTLSLTIEGSPWTVSLWLKRGDTTSPGTEAVIRFHTDIATIMQISHVWATLSRSVRLRTNNTDRVSATLSKDELWHHVVVSYDGSTGYSIYLDGVKTTATSTPTTGSHDTFGVSNANVIFRGSVDNIGVWQRQLTDEEAAQLYNSGSGLGYTPPSPATVYAVLTINSGPNAGKYIITKA